MLNVLNNVLGMPFFSQYTIILYELEHTLPKLARHATIKHKKLGNEEYALNKEEGRNSTGGLAVPIIWVAI